ncbi:hypothetical protein [Desulfovibrio legallii]
MRNNPIRTIAEPLRGPLVPKGYDPELLYVECGRCGSPVMWEKGKASQILGLAGIDPLELDASCMLVTDGCPMCGGKGHYTVQIFRVGGDTPARRPPYYGNAGGLGRLCAARGQMFWAYAFARRGVSGVSLVQTRSGPTCLPCSVQCLEQFTNEIS